MWGLRFAGMSQGLKQAWREFKRSPPGRRFRELYERRRRSRHAGAKRAVFIGGGLLTVAAGVASFPVPLVPSELMIITGLAVFAQGSGRAARVLDWVELRLRGPLCEEGGWPVQMSPPPHAPPFLFDGSKAHRMS